MDRRFMFKYRVQNMSITYHFAHPELPLRDGINEIAGSLTVKSLSNGYLECGVIEAVNVSSCAPQARRRIPDASLKGASSRGDRHRGSFLASNIYWGDDRFGSSECIDGGLLELGMSGSRGSATPAATSGGQVEQLQRCCSCEGVDPVMTLSKVGFIGGESVRGHCVRDHSFRPEDLTSHPRIPQK